MIIVSMSIYFMQIRLGNANLCYKELLLGETWHSKTLHRISYSKYLQYCFRSLVDIIEISIDWTSQNLVDHLLVA